jgi:hypothetical protein
MPKRQPPENELWELSRFALGPVPKAALRIRELVRLFAEDDPRARAIDELAVEIMSSSTEAIAEHSELAAVINYKHARKEE